MISRIQSEFAILDVKRGRHALRKRLWNRIKTHPYEEPVKVVIEGVLGDIPWGSDDGTSQEFSISVTKVRVIT